MVARLRPRRRRTSARPCSGRRRIALCALTLSLAGSMSCEGFLAQNLGPQVIQPQPQEPLVAPAVLHQPGPVLNPEPASARIDRPVTANSEPAALSPGREGLPGKTGPVRADLRQVGRASYYCTSLHGARTANGERYNAQDLTAAHRSLPFGSLVRVTNVKTGRSVVVRINDRGPFLSSRIIDLSSKAAEAIGMMRSGTTQVVVEPLAD